MLTERQTKILTEVRAFLGPDYSAIPGRWAEAARRDVIALEKALKDTRQKIATPGRDPVRNKGAWMWRAFISQASLEITHRTEGPRP